MNRRRFLSSIALGALGGVVAPRIAWAMSGSGRSLRVVFFTDVHAIAKKEISQKLSLAAERINEMQGDIVIAGGDLISGGYHLGQEQAAPHWKEYLNFQNAICGSVHAALGNHDLVGARPKNQRDASSDPRSEFKRMLQIADTYYSFSAAGYYFIVLDAVQVRDDDLEYRGFVDTAQMEWLKATLLNIPVTAPIILVSHIPLMTAFFQATQGARRGAPANRVVVNSLDVLALFSKRNLIAVLQGHLHVNEVIVWRGVKFITGGAICGRWWGGEHYGTGEGFGVLSLCENTASWEYCLVGSRV